MCRYSNKSTKHSCSKVKDSKVSKKRWAQWLLPMTGLVALIWFLIRVIPKPSRAAYPCQRAAAPLASTFVLSVTGAFFGTAAYHRAKTLWMQSRGWVAICCVVLGAVAIGVAYNKPDGNPVRPGWFIPSDAPNTPVGEGCGIYPGRVVWIHEPNATCWDGETGEWWDDENTDQTVVDAMLSQSLQLVTNEPNDVRAWEELFRYFNARRGLLDQGYQTGEKFAIKINMNQDTSSTKPWRSGAGMPTPQLIHAVLTQLIEIVQVPGHDITVYDVSKFIGDPIYAKVRGNPDPQFQDIRFVVEPDSAVRGRIAGEVDPNVLFRCSGPDVPNGELVLLPRCVTEATYLINMSLFRSHQNFGVTLCAKNHFGSIWFPSFGFSPGPLHSLNPREGRPMGSYSGIVDLMGHEQLGGKTLLYMTDALYGQEDQMSPATRFKSFGNDWSSSLFVSQDPVAIDSVGLDFLRNESEAFYCHRIDNYDNYLHEAAMAHEAPSGIEYDPEGDGVPLASLGVHEHWNNAEDKQYSRNLGFEYGIELITLDMSEPNE